MKTRGRFHYLWRNSPNDLDSSQLKARLETYYKVGVSIPQKIKLHRQRLSTRRRAVGSSSRCRCRGFSTPGVNKITLAAHLLRDGVIDLGEAALNRTDHQSPGHTLRSRKRDVKWSSYMILLYNHFIEFCSTIQSFCKQRHKYHVCRYQWGTFFAL